MDLQNPTAKMSKSSATPAGRIEVLDPPEVIRRKIRSAVTDSGREVLARPDKPAISNLLELFSVATSTRSASWSRRTPAAATATSRPTWPTP
jgi:tryptophanyl-tRNA synthetase